MLTKTESSLVYCFLLEMTVLFDDDDSGGYEVFADVFDGRRFPLLAEGGLVDAALDFVEVLEVVHVLPHAVQELLFRHRVGRGELLRHRLQPHRPVREDRRVAVDVVGDVGVAGGVDDLEEAAVVLVAAVAVHGDVDAAALDDVDARQAVGGDELLVGREEALLEAAGDLGLQLLGPVAEEEDAALDDGERVLVVDLCVAEGVPWRSSSLSFMSTRLSSSPLSSSRRTWLLNRKLFARFCSLRSRL